MLLVNYLSPPPSCQKDSQCIMGRWSCFQDSLLQPLSLGMNKLIMFQVAVLDVRLSILHKSAYKLNLTLHYLRSKRLGTAVPNNSNVNIAVSCISSVQFSSVQFSHSVVSDSLRPHELQHARPPCPSPTPGVYSDSRPSSQSCHPAISSSVVPFSSCPQALPASESFPMSQLFA